MIWNTLSFTLSLILFLGGMINNVKFVTPPGDGIRLTSAFVESFGSWRSVEWSGNYFFLNGVGVCWN